MTTTPDTLARIDIVDRLEYGLIETVWKLYNWTFRDLAARAAARHIMKWPDFLVWAQDEHCPKYLAWSGDDLVGIGTQANVLDAWPLISPPYFARRWPDLFDEGHIWYVGFIGVKDGNPGVFRDLLRVMSQPARAAEGITVMDFAAYNIDDRHLPEVAGRILSGIRPGTTMRPVDRQEFWLADFTATGGA